ncbi:NAD(P)/FAD-dependent oxidoreductase [Oceanicella sp. SM1341]|uniref:NAD(P)/FAD-dependent oxidoreductase n=1 Tax=Oceanicella sp. SM1341 TaxID=1548889 RepID=UPI0018E59520|nr:FAD-dependent oxidoreductase [Oceanicella sp. SM1341]
MNPLKIAVIGSGISGLSAAWLLAQRHQVTLYETEGRLGGHANTVDVDTPAGPVPVDTGFIVFNELNYPNLTALFGRLGVESRATQMSFAFSADGGRYEYAGSGAGGFFGQPANLFRPDHWRLLRDVRRFFRTAQARVQACPEDTPLGAFLAREGYGEGFVNRHILPMGAAIWSTSAAGMLDFPARSFIDFYGNHGLLRFRDRPAWRTVCGGSREYVNRLLAGRGIELQPGNAVNRVVRHPGFVHVTDGRGTERPFDHAVLATHADQALGLIDAPDAREREVLGAFSYQDNTAVLHRDARWMPKRRRLWSSWNYMARGGRGEGLCVTYWMNRLQGLASPVEHFVTLNPWEEIHPKAVDARFTYRHPVFDAGALAAQRRLWALQGPRRTWFCGSYAGHGFHEDGLQSGLAVAEELGGVTRPWQVENPSGRITLAPAARMETAV